MSTHSWFFKCMYSEYFSLNRFSEILLETGLVLVHPMLRGISSRIVLTRAATMVTRGHMKSLLCRRKRRMYKVMIRILYSILGRFQLDFPMKRPIIICCMNLWWQITPSSFLGAHHGVWSFSFFLFKVVIVVQPLTKRSRVESQNIRWFVVIKLDKCYVTGIFLVGKCFRHVPKGKDIKAFVVSFK